MRFGVKCPLFFLTRIGNEFFISPFFLLELYSLLNLSFTPPLPKEIDAVGKEIVELSRTEIVIVFSFDRFFENFH